MQISYQKIMLHRKYCKLYKADVSDSSIRHHNFFLVFGNEWFD